MIAAVDPGHHTAVAWSPEKNISPDDLRRHVETWEYEADVPVTSPAKVLYEAEIAMAAQCVDDILSKGVEILLIEDFIPRMMNRTRGFLGPVRVTIAMLSFLYDSPDDLVIEFPPSSAMNTISDERLKALGLWVPGSLHQRAAVKHLAVYLRKR
jgi:hypothetical protein